MTELASDTWVAEVKRILGKKLPLAAAPSALRFPLSQFQLFSPPLHALAAETLKLQRTLSDDGQSCARGQPGLVAFWQRRGWPG